MPRAVDRRNIEADYDPTRSGTEIHPAGLAKGLAELLAQIIPQALENMKQGVVDLIKEISGIDFTSTETFLQSFAQLIINGPSQLENFVRQLFIAAGNFLGFNPLKLPDVDIIGAIRDALDGIDLGGDPGAIIRAILGSVRTSIESIRTAVLRNIPQIGIGAIGDIAPNLLLENAFAEAITIDPGTEFYWDGTDGKTAPGCAAVDCDGIEHFLVSDKIPVAKDQQLNVGAFVSHAGVGAGANPISVELLTFGSSNGGEIIAQLPSAAVDDTDWSVQLSGNYTVPAGVDEVAVLLRVTSAATAGVVKFDDCWVKKVQRLPIPWVADLSPTLSAAAQKVKDIIDRIFNGWANLGEMLDLDQSVDTVLDSITGLLNMGLGARADTAAVEARVRALESSASTIVDDFARASSSSLGPNYVVRSLGGGAGSIGLDGKGNGVWKPSGAGNRTQYARRNDMTVPTDGFLFRMVISSNPQSYIFDDAFTYFLARMNATSNTMVRLRLGWGTANLQAVNSDGVTNLGSTATITSAMAGKTLEWQGGEPGGLKLRHFTVKLDNELIIDTTDGDPVTGVGAASQIGPSFRSVGIGMETGNRLVLFQNIPSGCAFYSVSELP